MTLEKLWKEDKGLKRILRMTVVPVTALEKGHKQRTREILCDVSFHYKETLWKFKS